MVTLTKFSFLSFSFLSLSGEKHFSTEFPTDLMSLDAENFLPMEGF